jgi:hypothetical protein
MDMTKIIQVLSEALDDKPIQGYEKDSDVDNENLWG